MKAKMLGMFLLVSLRAAAQTNPVPLINQITPPSVSPHSDGLDITVLGANFAPNAVVNWNGSPRVTFISSSDVVHATLTAADLLHEGTGVVTVTNPLPGGGISNQALFSVRRPGSSVNFARFDHHLQKQAVGAVATGDFNADGKADVVVASGNNIDVLLGQGNGNFGNPILTIAPFAPAVILAADFNGDGVLDLAVEDGLSKAAVLLGNGDGTFTSKPSFNSSTKSEWMVAGDLNRDGKLDLVSLGTIDSLQVFLGNGDGTFQAGQVLTSFSAGGNMALGDFNGDGKLDLVVPDAGFNVFLGNGDGTFNFAVSYIDEYSESLSTADLNDDGNLDIVGDGYVWLGHGDGTFSQGQGVSSPSMNNYIDIADFNGDGQLDVAVNFYLNNLNTIAVFLGNGDGTHQSQLLFTGGTFIGLGLGLADFNNDGRLDLVETLKETNDAIAVFLQTPLAASPQSLGFPDTAVGQSSTPEALTVANVGDAPLTIAGITFTGRNASDFSQTNDCTTLPAGATCTVEVTFAPVSAGGRLASLDIRYPGLGNPLPVSLVGNAIIPPMVSLSATSLNFPLQQVGSTSGPMPVTVTNVSSETVSFSSVTSSAQFGQSNNCNFLNPGASCLINVTFSPLSSGIVTGTLSLFDNAADSPQTLPLTGTGTSLKLSLTGINFANQPVNTTSPPESIQLTNSGDNPITISQILIAGSNPSDFAQTNTCGTHLGGHQSCRIMVTFTPRAVGARAATLSITDSDPGSPQTVALSGTGT